MSILGNFRGDGWVAIAKGVGTAAVAIVVLTVSAVQLVKLAEQVHINEYLRWTLFVALDVGGGMGAVVWAKGSTSEARGWGAGIALFSLLESVAGNVLSDLIQANIVHVEGDTGVWLVICVGAVYPLTLFLMIHLLIVSSNRGKKTSPRHAKQPEPRRAEAVREHVVPKPAPVTTVVERKPIEQAKPEPASVVALADASSKREQGRQYYLTQAAAGRTDITAREVDQMIGANGYSKKHIQDWRNEAANLAGSAVAGN